MASPASFASLVSALIPLAGPANKQGRIVADNIVFGNKEKYPGSIGTSIAKVFDLTVAAAGANAKLLQRNNIPYISSYTHGASHAGYYPGAVPLSIKILFAPENGKLLGAQIVGFNGVDKRIEMMDTSDTARRYSPRPDGIGTCLCTSLFVS